MITTPNVVPKKEGNSETYQHDSNIENKKMLSRFLEKRMNSQSSLRFKLHLYKSACFIFFFAKSFEILEVDGNFMRPTER